MVTRRLLCALVFTIPGLAFANGRIDAWYIKHNGGDLLVTSGLELPVDPHHPVSYLGRLGDFLFYTRQPQTA